MGLHLSGGLHRAGPHRAAVLGRPIGHSLSPVLHRAGYAALGLSDWTYDSIDCGEAELPGVVAASGSEWAGYSVTMPGKRVALAVADRIAPTAALVGAANTLLRAADGTWTADNTDVAGIVAALNAFGIDDLRASDAPPCVVLGAGGTAQAVLVAISGLGVRNAQVLVRDRRRTGEVMLCAQRAGIHIDVHEFGSAEGDHLLAGPMRLFSTLPAYAADRLAERVQSAQTVLLDAIYDPWPTALAQAVTRAGGVSIGGVEILIGQAVEQLRLMTGRAVDPDVLRAAVAAVRER